MKKIKTTICEMIVLTVVAGAVAFGANGLRVKGSLLWTKNYFEKRGIVRTSDASASPTSDGNAAVPAPDGSMGVATEPGDSTAGPTINPDHGFFEVSFDQVADMHADVRTAEGTYVFVDARDDDAFAAGHIPGALQCDHYNIDQYLDDVLPYVAQAEKVIVYCSGGDCEDSIFVSGDLMDRGVPHEKLLLYAGGFKEWVAKEMPVDTLED